MQEMSEMQFLSLGQGRSPERRRHSNPLQYSCLENLRQRSLANGHDWSNFAHTHARTEIQVDHQLPTVGLCCAFIIQCLLFSDDHRKKATGKCQTLTLSPFSPSALFNEERAGFSINGVGISTCKRMKLDPYLTPYRKINSKQVKTQLLEENIVGKLHDTEFDNDLLVMTLKTQATKGKVCKLDFITVTNLCIRAHEQQRKKAPQGMGKSIWKCCIWEGINATLPSWF